jgi:hypothetical protein
MAQTSVKTSVLIYCFKHIHFFVPKLIGTDGSDDGLYISLFQGGY